ncbi:hypothetical protein K458DRAFT_394826 [Lentithecium fluviatile CBS 122367]|uniref:Uncharacterized protein n=1 Tax=Lentithecium fluviatile CBS 122367 TaxID=1168545 RepID=A0A6G1IKY9_9PLEO|nr:hypothetical protein K458DRAFT_394826 [Lentithecium fluviatile CBS 122367]
MSQYPSMPPPGAYVPPNQNQGAPPPPPQQQQQQQQQQPHYGGYQQQTPSPYGAPAAPYGAPASGHKPTNALGQAFNQAMTTGKPMLNKLGKTISSRLGSKPSGHGAPQHLESYQNYQQHQQQAHPPSYQNQQYNPQQSPFSQPSYGSPASANSGQSNYFPQQAPQTPNPQAPPQQAAQQQPPAAPGYNPNVFAQGGTAGSPAQGPPPYGQGNPGQPPQPAQSPQPQAQGQPPQGPPQAPSEQYSGQQTGVVGGPAQPPPTNPQSPQNQQQQWAPPTTQAASPVPPQQQPQSFNSAASPVSQPPQPQPFNPAAPPQQYGAAPPVPVHPSQQQQQWTATSPVSPQLESAGFQPIPPVSPPPQLANSQPPNPNVPPEPQQPHQPPTPASQTAPPQASPTEFVAELPADLGNLSIVEDSKPQRPPSVSSVPGSAYQAYRPSGSQSASPRPGFTVPRRAVSTSSQAIADPWRLADPATELPTREFFIIADIIFDALDRNFEPRDTGLLEASKLLESWKVQGFEDDAARLFTHDSYIAFARLWSLEEIPHLMVPQESALAPRWNFQQQSHAQELKIPMSVLSNTITPTYMPALNRAGFYKYLFLTMMHEPDKLEQMLNAYCGDTYKPGVLNQPDVQKRDKTPLPGLAAQATAIETAALSCVCQEMAALVQPAQTQSDVQATQAQTGAGVAQAQPSEGAAQGQSGGSMTPEEMMLKMHSLKMQQQFNNMMNHTMVGGGISFSTAAGNTYVGGPNYGSLV